VACCALVRRRPRGTPVFSSAAVHSLGSRTGRKRHDNPPIPACLSSKFAKDIREHGPGPKAPFQPWRRGHVFPLADSRAAKGEPAFLSHRFAPVSSGVHCPRARTFNLRGSSSRGPDRIISIWKRIARRNTSSFLPGGRIPSAMAYALAALQTAPIESKICCLA